MEPSRILTVQISILIPLHMLTDLSKSASHERAAKLAFRGDSVKGGPLMICADGPSYACSREHAVASRAYCWLPSLWHRFLCPISAHLLLSTLFASTLSYPVQQNRRASKLCLQPHIPRRRLRSGEGCRVNSIRRITVWRLQNWLRWADFSNRRETEKSIAASSRPSGVFTWCSFEHEYWRDWLWGKSAKAWSLFFKGVSQWNGNSYFCKW